VMNLVTELEQLITDVSMYLLCCLKQ